MYVHLGEDVLVNSKDIVGIFDLEKTTISKFTKDFLSNSTKNHCVITVSYEMPKSFVVCCENQEKTTVYISQISPATLKKRTENNNY